MKKITLLVIALLSLSLLLSAHDYKAKVIIDTDCAPDDLRAINLLFANDHVEVIAITVTPGACSAEEGYRKVKALLASLNRDQIPVGVGRENTLKIPAWRSFAESVVWGESIAEDAGAVSKADSLIVELLEKEKDVSMIMLGSMANLHRAMQGNKKLVEQIVGVYWFNNFPGEKRGKITSRPLKLRSLSTKVALI